MMPSLPPPLPSVPFAIAVEDPRPTSLRVLCILGMIFGGFGLLMPMTTLLQYVNSRSMLKAAGPAATQPAMLMQHVVFERQLLPWTIGTNVAQVVIGGVLLWLAFNAWRLRPGGRRGMLAYAVFAICWSIGFGAVNAFVIMPAMFEPLSRPPSHLPPAIFYWLAVAAGALTALVGTAYPICLLVFFRRPNVVAAFARAASKSP